MPKLADFENEEAFAKAVVQHTKDTEVYSAAKAKEEADFNEFKRGRGGDDFVDHGCLLVLSKAQGGPLPASPLASIARTSHSPVRSS